MERVREIRIKRANTDWWINEKSIVGMNGLTYIAYMTDMGERPMKYFTVVLAKNHVTLMILNTLKIKIRL